MNEDDVFGRFPLLTTERLVLREIRETDVDAAFRLFSDPEAMRYVGHAAHKDPEETREILERNRIQFPNRDGIRWVICASSLPLRPT